MEEPNSPLQEPKNSSPSIPVSTPGKQDEIHTTKKRIRLAVSVFYFFQGLCFASWASRIPYIKSELKLSDSDMGSILFGLPIGQFVMMSVSAWLVKKYGSSKVVRLSLPLYALVMTNMALARTGWQLALALFCFGLFGNLCNIAVNTQGIDAEKMYHRSIMASFHGAWSLAGFSGAIIGLVMSLFNIVPYIHFWIIAVLTIIAVLLNQHYLVSDGIPAVKTVRKKKPFFHKPDTAILELGIIGFFAMACEGAMFDWSGIYFKDIVKAKGGLVTLGYTCFMIMMATGRFMGDRLIARYGRKKLMQVCGLLIMGGLFIAVLLPYVPTAAFGFLLVGCGVSTNIPNVYSVAGEQSKMSPSVAIASVASISFLGFLIGPPLIGYTSALLNLRLSYSLIAVFGLCITLMVTRLKVIR